MKKIFFGIVCVFIFFAFFNFAKAATKTASSCNFSDVQSAYNSASTGDTVTVPAGSCTWNSSLTITKGINLIGAGRDSLTITGGWGMITIAPSSATIANNDTIRISGFTFNGNNSTNVLMRVMGAGPSSPNPFRKLIIGNNRFKNMNNVTSGSGAINLTGQVRGVIYSNIFDRCNVIAKIMGNDSVAEWTNGNFPRAYGSSDNLYFEDNTIIWSSAFSGGDPGWTETGQGGRWVFRYNSINGANAASFSEVWDIHGFQNWPSNGQTGTMITEYYGNTITNASPWRWMNHRGGWAMIHNNIAVGSGGMGLEVNQYASGDTGGSGCNAEVSGLGSADGEIRNTYAFNNTMNGSLRSLFSGGTIGNGCTVTEANRSYQNYNASCTGSTCSSGIGKGTSAPTGSCATEAGYWVSTNTGPTVNPGVIQSSTFYKCTSPNTWTVYYTPYTYPHPLRSGDMIVPVCTPNWTCTAWSVCVNSTQNRTCTDSNNCGVTTNKPATNQSCTSAKTADLNGDNKVDIFDYTLFSQNFGKTGSNIADLNSDNKVDIFDYTILAEDFGKSF